MKKNNSINIPEAREAMDKFKMEAASDFGVPNTSKNQKQRKQVNPT